jgi:alanine racemase
VLPRDLDAFLQEVAERPELEVVSAYAHYANIEDTTDPSHAFEQECVFEECLGRLRSLFPQCGRHLSATSGLMAREGAQSKNDLVRVGIGLYGLYPSAPLRESHASLDLRPAMRWVSSLAQVKAIPSGHPVGYGLSFVAPRDMTIGVVPQGYADGWDRGLSNRGEVLIRGVRCGIAGRVAMNMSMVDLSSVPSAWPGDEVVLIGSQGNQRITADEVAELIDTINYEVVARVSPLLERVVVP